MSSKVFYGDIEEYDEDDNLRVQTNYSNKDSSYRLKIKSGNWCVTCYSSKMTPGAIIYNAVNGKQYVNWFVGKNPFFKVSVLGNHLYYEYPEEYENHFKIRLNAVIKENWLKNKENRPTM